MRGQVLAYAAPSTHLARVLAIETAPETKIERMRNLARASSRRVRRVLESDGRTPIRRDGRLVRASLRRSNFIAGNASLGLEILEDLPAVQTVIAAIGGGGLVSESAAPSGNSRPRVKILGAEPETAAPGRTVIRKRPRRSNSRSGNRPSSMARAAKACFRGCGSGCRHRRWLDRRHARRDETGHAHGGREGAGHRRRRWRAGGRGALSGKAGEGPIVAVISGGNIDLKKFAELIGAA